jgi:NAD(P)-dependent dehydrogenase (short-subunit alcohol dehydrogenase family)
VSASPASVEGRCIVVTGATRGIGKVTATHLAGLGAHVAVVGRHEGRAERVVADITSSGGRASFFRCDLTNEKEVAALFDEVVTAYGRVHAVVSNAAATDLAIRDRPVVDQPTEDFDYFVRSNVHSAFWCFKYGIPAMAGEGGAFVTISSIEAITPRRGEPSYSASKAAVCGLARQVAVDYGAQGIRSNILMLGFVETNATRPFLQDPRIGDVIREATGGAPPTSFDAAQAVAFLVSDAANGFNGATLTLDRGMTIFGRVPDLAPGDTAPAT